MANNLNYRTEDRNSMLDVLTSAIGSNGLLRIYDGSQPASVATALSGQTLLAELALSATAAAAAASGVLTFNSITADSSANATGTAAWFTVTTSGGTRIIDGTVGTSGTDMIIDNTSIVAGQNVSCSAFAITGGNA